MEDVRRPGRKGRRRGPTSATKFVPDEIFEFADEEIARFLAALWDCDGHVGARAVTYKTISPTLAVGCADASASPRDQGSDLRSEPRMATRWRIS